MQYYTVHYIKLCVYIQMLINRKYRTARVQTVRIIGRLIFFILLYTSLFVKTLTASKHLYLFDFYGG